MCISNQYIQFHRPDLLKNSTNPLFKQVFAKSKDQFVGLPHKALPDTARVARHNRAERRTFLGGLVTTHSWPTTAQFRRKQFSDLQERTPENWPKIIGLAQVGQITAPTNDPESYEALAQTLHQEKQDRFQAILNESPGTLRKSLIGFVREMDILHGKEGHART